MVDEPRAGSYGSTVAAPLFKAIMEDVLPYLGIEKTGETVQSIPIRAAQSVERLTFGTMLRRMLSAAFFAG